MLNVLFSPAVIGIVAVFLSVVWMLRDETDRTRPFLAIALVINLFYGWLLSIVMGHENGLVPWKYDYVLFNLDHALGVPGTAIAQMLQQVRIPLLVTYELMVPMMIAWFLVARRHNASGSIVVAYVAEMITGPILYAILPGCGPLYAFHGQWLHPPAVEEAVVRLSGMPNAFPSLHTATALVFVSFARGKLWQTVSIAFLAGTLMATMATGEHYVIDLVAGLAFGCFAANAGRRRIARSLTFLSLVLAWSLTVRFAYGFLIAHASVLQLLAGLTVTAAIVDTVAQWRADTGEIQSVAQQALQPST
jgi:hypothetical protein